MDNQIQEQEIPSLPPKNAKFANEETPKYKAYLIIKTALLILASSILVAFAAHCLIEPNRFTIGGVAGLAIMLSYATNGAIPQSLIVFSINMPMLVLSFFFVKKKFALLTTANSLLQSLWLFILERVNAPVIQFQDAGTNIFAAIGAGVCIGASVALALKAGGSTGGLDVIAVMIQKKTSAPSVAQLIALFSSSIIVISFFVYRNDGDDLATSLLPILLSLFEVYIERKTNDAITNGFQSAIEFRVVTDKPEEMSIALMRELSRGVTAIPATGMFLKEQHTMLVCVVSRNQINAFKRIIKRVDPNSFAVLSNVSQVVGLGFYQGEN